MPKESTRNLSCTSENTASSLAKDLRHRSSIITRTLAHLAAWLFVGASICIGATYGFGLGEKYSLAIGAVFALAAVAGEISKPLAVASIFDAAREWRFGKAAAATALALVCILYSLAADLALSSTLRGDLAAQRSAAIDEVAAAKAKRLRAEHELAALPYARSSRELAPQIEKLEATPGANRCEKIDGTISRRVCGEVADLEAEAARDHRRQQLKTDIAEAGAVIAAVPMGEQVGAADPLATAIAAYATATGLKLHPTQVSPWLALLLPLFIEVGSTLGLVVARGFDTAAMVSHLPKAVSCLPETSTARIEALRNTPEQEVGKGVPSPVGTTVPAIAPPDPSEVSPTAAASVPACPRKSTNRDDDGAGPSNGARLGTALLGHLKEKGGKVTAGQRGLARLLGTSTTELNRTIHRLAAAGVVFVTPDRLAGTTIELANA